MGVKEKRAKYNTEFRSEILEAARELFIDQGYEKFTMRRLAEKIGYSPTTLYIYFKSKDDLLFAICEEVAEHFFANLKRLRTLDIDPLDVLRQALHSFLEFGFEHPNQYKVFFFTGRDVYGTHDEFLKKESIARNSFLAFREIVQNCIETGKFREMDAEILTQVLSVATHGLIIMTNYRRNFPWVDRTVLADTLIDGLINGYRKEF